ncbi:testis-specific serine/threonine-protein kinase 6 [Anableps anableps]
MMDKTFMETRGYTFKGLLGEGTFGKVVKAESVHLKKLVAIKIISTNKNSSINRDKFFSREKEIIRSLKHPNIVKTYEVFVSRLETVYVVMELCPQGDVSMLIAARGTLEECFSCRLFKQLCLAVQYLHGINVVHRDIKCENLLLDMHYNLKLCDFGFSEKLTYVHGKVVLSDTHCGTLLYAAPEILKNLSYNPKVSDVWSMGIVLYKMLCGSLPFGTTNVTKLVQLQVRHCINFPNALSISPEARSLIHSILHPVAEYRMATHSVPRGSKEQVALAPKGRSSPRGKLGAKHRSSDLRGREAQRETQGIMSPSTGQDCNLASRCPQKPMAAELPSIKEDDPIPNTLNLLDMYELTTLTG